jgi:hypothetical protein
MPARTFSRWERLEIGTREKLDKNGNKGNKEM